MSDEEFIRQTGNTIKRLTDLLSSVTMDSRSAQAIDEMRRKNIELLLEKEGIKVYPPTEKCPYFWARPKGERQKIYGKTREEVSEKIYGCEYGEENSRIGELWRPACDWYSSMKHSPSVSVKRYDWAANKYLLSSAFAKKRISAVDITDVTEYLYSFQGKVTSHELGSIKTVINRIWDYAIYKGYVNVNLARQVNTRSIMTKAEEDKGTYTDEEREKLLDALSDSNEPKDLFITFMFCICARIGEVRALRVSDIDFENRTVSITKQITARGELPHTKKGHDAGSHIYPLSDRALDAARRAVNGRNSGFLFEGIEGKPINDGALRKYLSRVCRRIGIRYLSPHKMRAYAATKLVQAGADLNTLMSAGGWSDKQTALHYVKEVRDTENLRSFVGKLPD